MKTYKHLNILGVGVIAFGLILGVHSFGASTKQAPVSAEQQGILAVRGAKPAVVSILGTNVGGINNATTTGLVVAPVNTISGSGFIVEANGLIVSNNHVVSDASLNYTVTLTDGTQYPAKVLALDKYDDIAILKIDAKGLPVAKLGDSDSLETGQSVFAIGNALGEYQNTVTRGVVSGLGRAITPPTSDGSLAPRLQNLIQTDAAINPGNSGGPLIDISGNVIGMDTLIDTSGNGLGFAIPINTIKSAVNQLEVYGKVQKAYLGVKFQTLDPSLSGQYNVSVSDGAYIAEVAAGSPAAAAGLQNGDVIIAINHEKLNQVNQLDTVAGKYNPGAQILVTYMRGKQQLDAALVLGILP